MDKNKCPKSKIENTFPDKIFPILYILLKILKESTLPTKENNLKTAIIYLK
jgi:hypothetical protein